MSIRSARSIRPMPSIRPVLAIVAGAALVIGPAHVAYSSETADVTQSIVVDSLADAGPGSLRAALETAIAQEGARITFAQPGTITLASALPEVTVPLVVDGTQTPGYVEGGAPRTGIDFAGSAGFVLGEGADGSQILSLALGNAGGDGVVVRAGGVTITGSYVGLSTDGSGAPNGGHGVRLAAGSDGSTVGSNPQTTSSWVSNVISGNGGSGIAIVDSSSNVVAANRIGTDPAGQVAVPNAEHGIVISGASSANMIGGTASVDLVTGVENNPTGDKGKAEPTSTRPPLGNVVSGNAGSGIAVLAGAEGNTLAGNFVGTSASGDEDLGNGAQGILVSGAHGTQILGCSITTEPFVYYNVVSGNGSHGIEVRDADDVTIQGNFTGVAADNATSLGNDGNGLLVAGTSANTQAGGVIPLGNVTSGNARNGIAVTGAVTGFVSFNNFAGLVAFGGAAPNALSGIYVSATGGDNLIRTSVTSGNIGSGITLAGRATGVTIDPVISGMTTSGADALPNGGDGLTITGRAHGNVIGGTRKSVMPHTAFSGNAGYGIRIEGEARDNIIFDTYVGTIVSGLSALPNAKGGILVTGSARNNIIGGKQSISRRANVIAGNEGNGVTLSVGTSGNKVFNNYIGVSRLGKKMPNEGKPVVDRGRGNVVKSNTLR